MSKSIIYYLINATVFLFAVIAFWMELTILYKEPLVIASFNPADFVIVLYIAVTIALVMLPISLLLVVATNPKERYLLYAVASLLSLIFFPHDLFLAVILLIGTFLSFHFFDRGTTRELENQINFKPHHILKRGISSFLATIALVISLGYYSSTLKVIHDFELTIPDQLFNQVINSMASQNLGQGQNTEAKIDEVTNQLFESQVKPKVIEQLNQAQITDPVMVQKYLSQARDELETKTKEQITTIDLKPTNNVITEVKKQAQDSINTIVTKYQKFLPLIFSFSLFALFQFMDIFVSLLVSTLLFAVIFLLQAGGILHKEVLTKNIEILRL